MLKEMATQLQLLPPLVKPTRALDKLPPLLSFFSGAGFLDLGFIGAGFDIAWSLEADAKICDAHNFGMLSHFRAAKLRTKPPIIDFPEAIQNKGPRAIVREAAGLVFGNGDFGVVGGPPCPDFSIGGKNRGEGGERGRLTRIFVERICELEPIFFLIENVKGLVSTRKHRQFLFGELWKLEEKGYAVDLKLLNALDLGHKTASEYLSSVSKEVSSSGSTPRCSRRGADSGSRGRVIPGTTAPKTAFGGPQHLHLAQYPQSRKMFLRSCSSAPCFLIRTKSQRCRMEPRDLNRTAASFRRFPKEMIRGNHLSGYTDIGTVQQPLTATMKCISIPLYPDV
jgi:C-5 cytosine-specific DNA methylase